jgi:hypothetical protein
LEEVAEFAYELDADFCEAVFFVVYGDRDDFDGYCDGFYTANAPLTDFILDIFRI